MSHCAWPLIYFFVETGFLHVGQAGLELLTSGHSPASASQSVGITDVSHHTQLCMLSEGQYTMRPVLPLLQSVYMEAWPTFLKSLDTQMD